MCLCGYVLRPQPHTRNQAGRHRRSACTHTAHVLTAAEHALAAALAVDGVLLRVCLEAACVMQAAVRCADADSTPDTAAMDVDGNAALPADTKGKGRAKPALVHRLTCELLALDDAAWACRQTAVGAQVGSGRVVGAC
jgi:hypothetical protein